MKQREPKTPNQKQVAALRRFAEHEGRRWKEALRQSWSSGCYPWQVRNAPNDLASLQQVRNQFGPGWLKNMRLASL
ncbi:MAG: hypothetical protein AB2809_07955 [Candidatus Thiodiazotropha sp.]